MKIRTQLIISMVFFGIVLAIISASVIATNQQVERLNKQEELARNIEFKVGELNYVSNNYLLYHEGQQIDRWESKYSSISADISNLTVDRPEQQVLVNNIKNSQQRLKEVFGDIVSKIEGSPDAGSNAADLAFIQVSGSRIGVQIQGMVFDASRLAQMLSQQADETKQQNNMLIFALIVAFIAFLLTDYILIYRRTLTSISNLQAGAGVIGSGNLDYSIVEKKSDEIGDLAEAFNRMAANLKTVTASKADLEREIVERKKAEEEIKSLAKFPEENPNPVLRVAADGTVAYANSSSAALLESWGCLIGQIIPDDYRSLIQETLSSGNNKEIEAKSGSTIYSLIFTPIVDMGYVNIYGRDITERKRAEQALHESEQRFKDAIDNFPNVFVIYDSDRRIRYINSKGLQIIGLSEQQVVGRRDEELFPPEMIDSYLPALKRAIETKTPQTLERTRHVSMGGQVIILNIIPLLDENGIVHQIIGITHDITERKRMEDELRKARDELELRVKERTSELSEAKENLEVINEELQVVNEELQVGIAEHEKMEKELMAAKDAAEEAVRAKAAFLANMSHELRTPMNSIIGFTSLLLEEPLPSEYKDWLDNMRMNGEALLALINDVLDFSRLEKERTELELHPFNLRARIEESLDLISTKAAEKGLDLAYTIDGNVPETIIMDSSRLRQVLANLLSNAAKFTDNGEVVISVSSKPEGEGHEIHFAVKDSGIGIPQNQMSKLFQPFSQVSTSTSRLSEGTGLGLAISRKLVEMMGGRIWVESEEGKGSTFHFTIKAKAAPESEPGKIPAGPGPQLAKRSVLIVDDNRTIRRILADQTHSWGMIPLVAASASEAIDLILKGAALDAAILDIGMPDIGGMTLAEAIRKYRKDLPLVMLTSVGQRIPSDLSSASLAKPIKPAQLYDTLTGLLAGRPLQTQEGTQAVGQVSISPLRILLAEDNVSSQKVTLGMLRKLGYRADVAANGMEAIQALERQPYDVVLMDIRMPDMDGFEATRQIRQRWPNDGPKIIAITAYALEGDREKCLEAGMDDYIGKPVTINELAEALSKCSPSNKN